MNNENYEYDIAFSYASEQREYVSSVVDYLKSKNINCFYDEDNTVELWGENLISIFNSVFMKKSKYCVIFFSKEYKEKMWCNHELKAALNRALSENTKKKVYILPVFCDNTLFEDIMPDVAYIKMSNYSPKQLAEMIHNKINNDKYQITSLIDVFSNIKTNLLENYKSVSNIKIDVNDTYFTVSILSHEKVIYFLEIKYLSNEKNQLIKLFESKINNSNICNIASAEIYLKNKKLYFFNYTFLGDGKVKEEEITVSDIKTIINNRLSFFEKYYIR